MAARVCCAGSEFTAPGDPNRSWNVSATTVAAYDDNFNGSTSDRQSSVRSTSDVRFRASVTHERLFVGGQYDYGISYPEDVKLGGYNQTHNLNISANYAVSPRLTMGFSEVFINALEPELIQGPANAPNTIVHSGTYVYDAMSGNLNYVLTPRWSLSVNGGWDIINYEDHAAAHQNDHEDYSATLSALYVLDPRTTVGVNYQYSQSLYTHPGPNNGLNGYSNTGYLSVVRRFNPRLSLSVNGGYTVRDSEDGTESTGPSAYASLVYNYGPADTISLTVAESLSQASFGITGQFSAQQNTTAALQVNHRLTARLRAVADATYTYSTFTQPLFGVLTVKPNDQAITFHVGLNYTFNQWLSAVMDYTYFDLTSSEPFLIAPYTRNLVSLGITLTY
jgi:predicted porin